MREPDVFAPIPTPTRVRTYREGRDRCTGERARERERGGEEREGEKGEMDVCENDVGGRGRVDTYAPPAGETVAGAEP